MKLQEVIDSLGLVSLAQAAKLLQVRGYHSLVQAVHSGVVESAHLKGTHTTMVMVRAADVLHWEQQLLAGVTDRRNPRINAKIRNQVRICSFEDAALGLSPREKRILRLRYGLDGERIHTFSQIGVLFGLTQQRIKQVEKHAVQKIALQTT